MNILAMIRRQALLISLFFLISPAYASQEAEGPLDQEVQIIIDPARPVYWIEFEQDRLLARCADSNSIRALSQHAKITAQCLMECRFERVRMDTVSGGVLWARKLSDTLIQVKNTVSGDSFQIKTKDIAKVLQSDPRAVDPGIPVRNPRSAHIFSLFVFGIVGSAAALGVFYLIVNGSGAFAL